MADAITIEEADNNWSVRAGGAVIGESSNALLLREEGHPFIVYFPRDDIAMAFLDATDKRTTCPRKGEASYFSIVTEALTLRDAVWSYEDPEDAVAQIAGHLAFMHEDVTVEQV